MIYKSSHFQYYVAKFWLKIHVILKPLKIKENICMTIFWQNETKNGILLPLGVCLSPVRKGNWLDDNLVLPIDKVREGVLSMPLVWIQRCTRRQWLGQESRWILVLAYLNWFFDTNLSASTQERKLDFVVQARTIICFIIPTWISQERIELNFYRKTRDQFVGGVSS